MVKRPLNGGWMHGQCSTSVGGTLTCYQHHFYIVE
jgi:hypothetical protein